MKPLLTEISINKKNTPALLGVIPAKNNREHFLEICKNAQSILADEFVMFMC